MSFAGGVKAFKSVTTVALVAGRYGEGRPEAFTENFFISLARKGVRTLDVCTPFIDIDLGPALAFGFAEPESGGQRVLTGVRCADGAGFLEQVREVNELARNYRWASTLRPVVAFAKGKKCLVHKKAILTKSKF